jgi:hypothetical protein
LVPWFALHSSGSSQGSWYRQDYSSPVPSQVAIALGYRGHCWGRE